MTFTKIFKKQLNIFALVAIVCLGAFLYFYNLNGIPSGLYIDEAGTGYNAYSLLKTGKDEYGKSFPIAMRFFGSYSPPLYTYLTIPIVAIFDLNPFSVRALSAVSGVLSIIVVYLILRSIKIFRSPWTALAGALMFAISPWTVFYSRTGYEMNLAFLLFCTTVLFFLKAVQGKPIFLTLALATLSISTYADYTQRVIGPFMLVGLLLLFRKELVNKKYLKFLVAGLVVGFIIQIPQLFIVFTPAFYTKTSLFYAGAVLGQAQKIAHFLPMFLAIPLAFIYEFLSKFFTYLSPYSLFFAPDPDPQRSIPDLSVFYPWMVLPFFIGIFAFLNQHKDKIARLIFILLILTIVPGALTKDPFHVQRTLPLLLPIIVIVTAGIDRLIHRKKALVVLPVLALTVLISLTLLWRSYFVFLPKEKAKIWGYGFAQLAEEIKKHPDQTFVIDQSVRMKPESTAYIQLAFFLKIPPKTVQNATDPDIARNYYYKTRFNPHINLGNIQMRQIDFGEAEKKKLILVGDELSVSDFQLKDHDLEQIFEIKDPVENVIFRGYLTNPGE